MDDIKGIHRHEGPIAYTYATFNDIKESNATPDPEERQVAPTLDGIRKDHTTRYQWAAMYAANRSVIDYGCGVGYGTSILAQMAAEARGVDCDAAAIRYALDHYCATGAGFVKNDVKLYADLFGSAVAVAFEVIEHLEDPAPFLRAINADTLLASVPNEHVIPFGAGVKFHHRHYTPGEFEQLLNACGWEVTEWWGQETHESSPKRDIQGRTQVVVARRALNPKGETWRNLPPPPDVQYVTAWRHPTGKAPETVMLCGLGPSKYELTEAMLRHDFEPWWDELWTINKGIDFLPTADVAMILDDVYDYATRHPAYGRAMRAFAGRGGTIISQTCLPNDGSIPFADFPLREVLSYWQQQGGNPQNWLHTISVGLIMAYAGFIGVRRLMLAGIDCSWPNRPDLAEAGNAVVCYWIGRLEQSGCVVEINSDSTLNNTRNMGRYDARPIYGRLVRPV